MNFAEHISAQVRWLTADDRITRTQLVEIIEEILQPFLSSEEPEHFKAVNDKIHRLLDVSDPGRNEVSDEDD